MASGSVLALGVAFGLLTASDCFKATGTLAGDASIGGAVAAVFPAAGPAMVASGLTDFAAVDAITVVPAAFSAMDASVGCGSTGAAVVVFPAAFSAMVASVGAGSTGVASAGATVVFPAAFSAMVASVGAGSTGFAPVGATASAAVATVVVPAGCSAMVASVGAAPTGAAAFVAVATAVVPAGCSAMVAAGGSAGAMLEPAGAPCDASVSCVSTTIVSATCDNA